MAKGKVALLKHVGNQIPTIPLILMLCEDSKLPKWLRLKL